MVKSGELSEMNVEADELTMALTKAINEFSGSLRTELAGQQCGDLSDVAALIEWLEALQEGVRLADREVVGTNMAKIRRAIYDGAFDSPVPARAYVDFDRVFQHWRTQVLYGE